MITSQRKISSPINPALNFYKSQKKVRLKPKSIICSFLKVRELPPQKKLCPVKIIAHDHQLAKRFFVNKFLKRSFRGTTQAVCGLGKNTFEVFYFNNYGAKFLNEQNRRDDKEECIVLTSVVFVEFCGAFQFFEDHCREERGHETVYELLNKKFRYDLKAQGLSKKIPVFEFLVSFGDSLSLVTATSIELMTEFERLLRSARPE